jgi:hypothetical protein
MALGILAVTDNLEYWRRSVLDGAGFAEDGCLEEDASHSAGEGGVVLRVEGASRKSNGDFDLLTLDESFLCTIFATFAMEMRGTVRLEGTGAAAGDAESAEDFNHSAGEINTISLPTVSRCLAEVGRQERRVRTARNRATEERPASLVFVNILDDLFRKAEKENVGSLVERCGYSRSRRPGITRIVSVVFDA